MATAFSGLDLAPGHTALFDQSCNGRLWVDANSAEILRCNPTAARVFQRRHDELVGASLVSAYPENAREQYEVLFETHGLQVAHDLEIVAADGEERVYSVETTSAAVLRCERGDVSVLELTLREVTDEREMRRLLFRRNEDLWLVSNELRDLTYLISHDLRSPMINLKGFAGELKACVSGLETLMKEAANGDATGETTRRYRECSAEAHDALSFIDASVERMERMISLLLAWSRIGRRKLRLETFEVASLVQDVLNSLMHQTVERKAVVEVRNLPTITADRAAVEQILGNLLDNAIRYLREDEPGRIVVSCESRNREFVFRIADNGCGIAPQHIETVFAPFKRFSRNDAAGEGMGLAYTRSLVGRHFGQIWCESELNEGTTFFFTIPEDVEKELANVPPRAGHDPAD